ncbi:MAG TPA: alpha-L-fucosidase [Bacteroidales bacterium]|nr:alpha-L-fucosidase [Bacteroidales bacterium]
MKSNQFKQFILSGFLFLILILSVSGQQQKSLVAEGPYKPTDESFSQYQYPEWFRDAKFGIWSHWGPQAVPRQGDWYAKRMYQEGNPAYKYHLEHYGHPSEFGFKDIIPLWKAERWDPEKLMELYKKAGAKYFVSMGTHHDNFFLWNSKINRWNAVNMGPKKDVVALWQKAAKNQGLKFGVSEHLGASFTWYQTSHGADKEGPMAGVSYDGANLNNQDLYHANALPDDKAWLTTNPAFQLEWYRSIKELIDNYQPDLLYSDSPMPFGDVGRTLIASLYNQDIVKNNGKLEAIYTCKQASGGLWVRDVERGVLDTVSAYPWQTDTSIGDWYYRTGQKYKTATEVIQMLVDIVSKNGNLLINVVQTPEGDLEPDMLDILEEIGVWTAANGDGIYGSRPWKIFGEKSAESMAVKRTRFNENYKFNSRDIRFTTKGETLYAYCLGKPESEIIVKSLGKSSKLACKAVASVSMVGSNVKLSWKQTADALVIKKPAKLPVWEVIGFKIEFRK